MGYLIFVGGSNGHLIEINADGTGNESDVFIFRKDKNGNGG